MLVICLLKRHSSLRAERAQQAARKSSEGKPTEELRKALMNPVHADEEQVPRFLQAFFMGIDPVKDAGQDNIPAHLPEVSVGKHHRKMP